MLPEIQNKARRLILGLGILALLAGGAVADTAISLAPDQLRAAAIA